MNDPINRRKSVRSASLDDMLRAEARRIPAPTSGERVAQVMRSIRATPRRQPGEAPTKISGWAPWVAAGATAAAAIVIALIVDETPAPPSARQVSVPRLVETRLDPVLAGREQALAGELQRLRADLDALGGMVSVRFESGSN